MDSHEEATSTSQVEWSDEEELELELIRGKNAADDLINHLINMSADKVEIPITVAGITYIVSARTTSTMECTEGSN
jgi:hypothetical protein